MPVQNFDMTHLQDLNFEIKFVSIQNFKELKLCLTESVIPCNNLTNSSSQTINLRPNEHIMFGMTPKFYVKTIGNMFPSCNENNEDQTLPKNVMIGKNNNFMKYFIVVFKKKL